MDILISNLPADANPDEIEELYADAGPVRRVDIKRNGRAVLHFVLETDAQRCLATMGERKLRGQTLNLTLYSVDENNPTVKRDPVNTRLFRLIIRNLPFGVKEAAVRSVFQDFGRLVEVHLPTKPGPDGPVGRGFGFLQYSSKKEAKEAVEKGNGIAVLGRPVAVDWALGKEFYEAVAPPRKTPAIVQPDKEPIVAPKKRANEDEESPAAERGDAERKRRKDTKANDSKQESAVEKNNEEETTAVFVRNIPLESTEDELAQVHLSTFPSISTSSSSSICHHDHLNPPPPLPAPPLCATASGMPCH